MIRKTTMSINAIAVVLLILAGLGCNPGNNPLTGTKWTVTSLAGTPVQANTTLTAEFTSDTLSGWTGCNSYSSSYSVGRSQITLDNPTWTEAGCPDTDTFNQEQLLQDLLADLETFALEGSRLTLAGNTGGITLEYVP